MKKQKIEVKRRENQAISSGDSFAESQDLEGNKKQKVKCSKYNNNNSIKVNLGKLTDTNF